MATTSIIGIGCVSYGIVFLVRYLEGTAPVPQLAFTVTLIVAGFALVIGAGVLQQDLRSVARRAVVEPAA